MNTQERVEVVRTKCVEAGLALVSVNDTAGGFCIVAEKGSRKRATATRDEEPDESAIADMVACLTAWFAENGHAA